MEILKTIGVHYQKLIGISMRKKGKSIFKIYVSVQWDYI